MTMEEKVEKLKNSSQKLKQEVNQRIIGYITAAFGLVAGLTWNDAIKSLIEYWFPMDKGSLWAKFVYAFFLTLILVIVTVYLVRFFNREENK
jgi:predicted small integral membrane protein